MQLLLWWGFVGLIGGWLTGQIMRGSAYGVPMDVVSGIAGAVLCGGGVELLGKHSESGILTIIAAVGGGIILTWRYHIAVRNYSRPSRVRKVTERTDSEVLPGIHRLPDKNKLIGLNR